jgi:hypothetical protein
MTPEADVIEDPRDPTRFVLSNYIATFDVINLYPIDTNVNRLEVHKGPLMSIDRRSLTQWTDVHRPPLIDVYQPIFPPGLSLR